MDSQDQSQLPEIAPSLQEMAKIVEFDLEENDPVRIQSHSQDGNVIDVQAEHPDATASHPEEGDDIDFQDEFDPEQNRTIVSLHNSGFAKTAVVLGGSFALIVGGAMMFNSTLPKNQVAQEVKAKPKDDALATAQAEKAKAQQSESETKAQLALAKQKDSLAQSSDTSPEPATAAPSSDSKPTNAETTSLTPLAKPLGTSIVSPANSRPVAVSGTARPIAVVPPVSNNFSATASRKSLAQPVTVAVMPIARSQGKKQQQSLVASNVLSSVGAKAKPRLSSRQLVNLAGLPIANQRSASTQAASALAANPTASDAANPFSNPLRRTTGSLDAANSNTAPAGRSLRDFLASNVATPGLVPNPTTNPNTETAQQVQQVAIPGRGVVARNIPVNRPTMVSDKILQQMAWVLPQHSPTPTPSDAPALAQGVQMAQGTQSLAEGIRLAQSTLGETAAQPNPSLNSGANGTRPSFYNSQVISGKSEDGKEDGMKAERLAASRISETPVTTEAAGQMAKGILVGTSAKGSTVTPILWNAGISSAAKFIIKLDEPIRDNTNRPAIPAGSQLVVTVKPAGTNIGFAELEVVSVIIQGQEFTAPVGMLVVRDEQNGLLVGEDYFKRNDQIASRDSMTILTGALGRVGQVLTQPASTISSSGLGSTTVVNNQNPNVLGAILDGGFSSLPATWSQRNQQALQEIANKPNVYQIPQGRSVRIFVNQTLEF